jgi:hypothetical protein
MSKRDAAAAIVRKRMDRLLLVVDLVVKVDMVADAGRTCLDTVMVCNCNDDVVSSSGMDTLCYAERRELSVFMVLSQSI